MRSRLEAAGGVWVALFACLACAGGDDAVPRDCRALTVDKRIGADWACSEPNTCTVDYLAFPSKAAAYARPITEDDLTRKLEDIEAGKVALATAPAPPETLKDAILDQLNMRFLIEGMEDRPLRVTVVGVSVFSGAVETRLLFEDPWVGTFKAILLTPESGSPSPGIVALHGHGEDAEIYRDRYHGSEYPGHGLAILMPTLRAMNIDDDEHQVTRNLLLAGFNLVALRAYESLLGLRYLRCRDDVDPGRLGLIGHSGGSSTGNLTVRLDPNIGAYVSDHQVDWYKSGENEPYHCETAPDLFPYHELINDFSTSPTPVLQVPYGYLLGMNPIWSFFGDRLGRVGS